MPTDIFATPNTTGQQLRDEMLSAAARVAARGNTTGTPRTGRVTTTGTTTPAPTPTPRIRVTRRTAAAAPTEQTVTLSGVFYPPHTQAPAADTVLTEGGDTILRSDCVTVSGGGIYHADDIHLGHCGRCSCSIILDNEPQVVHRPAPPTPGGRQATTHYCPDCRGNHTWSCSRCDVTVSDSVPCAYSPDDDEEDDPLCPSCAAPRANSLFGCMINYSNKDIGKVPPKDPSGMLYGWEVEVHLLEGGSTQRAIEELHRLLGPGYYVTKPDGSVDNGFEIVTRPDSMAVHREEWCRFFEALKESEFLRKHLRSWESPRQCCGIHCHIDKESLSALQLGKLATWINHPNNRSFIEKVAGRGSGSYTSFSDSVRVSDGRRLKEKTNDPERYVALNVQDKTAEMRIFRGTLQPRLFFKNMDFVEASVEWTGLSSCSARHVTDVARFARYVYDRRERFIFLYNMMVEWGVGPSKAA
mgnify:CR=1 FL=1